MEIALQERSKGILYEGYTKSFRQCIFEEGDVVGKNERYEFRCDDELDCCGRTCCIPEATTIPLWLMIIFIILAAVLLLAVLGTLVWLLAKRRKPKPKKEKFIPSPMQEESLPQPSEELIVQRNEDDISRALTFDMSDTPRLKPQRAQHAFYRPFVADPMEEVVLQAPLIGAVSRHSVAELSQTQMPHYKSFELPKSTNAERMYKRPGFDNVPSY
ncbi:hypothetical protein V3C99_018474 [Haemonchus contortus]|uniref:CX domain-containing protein n=1 Tax=Haemonchus contortus TaxID=6289 RepID=A0A7I4Z250_HAECO|nr:Protein C44C10.9, isoform a [Haemonchus contortus]